MTLPITVDSRSYCFYTDLVPPAPGAPGWAFPGTAEDRGFMSPKQDKIPLARTYGAYVTLGGHDVLVVIDDSVTPGSAMWGFIHKVAARLAASHDALDAAAKEALARLKAVVFVPSPDRSFAQVDKGIFFYDTDEIVRADGSWITDSYAASNVVHDANHVLMSEKGMKHWGEEAEKTCWLLQVANGAALGLDDYELAHLQKLIADPSLSAGRIIQSPF